MQVVHAFNTQKILPKIRLSRCACIAVGADCAQDPPAQQNGLTHIALPRLAAQERLTYERAYIKTLADLDLKYSSLTWWANGTSEKNEYSSSLYRDLFLYAQLVATLKQHQTDFDTIFIISNLEIYLQLRSFCKSSRIRLSSLEPVDLMLLKEQKEYFLSPLKRAAFIAKLAARKIDLGMHLGAILPGRIRAASKPYLLRTWLDKRFLQGKNGYDDAYFGNLAKIAEEKGYTPIFIAGIFSGYSSLLKKIKACPKALIIPEEYFLTLKDLCRLWAWNTRINLKGMRAVYMGQDVSCMIARQISKHSLNTWTLYNISAYLLATRIPKLLNVVTYIQTFENYAWEKMYLLGLRKSTRAPLLGYAHAYISRNSFKYFIDPREKDLVLLPERIVTMGLATARILTNFGNHAGSRIQAGCALRQPYLQETQGALRPGKRNILVPLNMVTLESISILKFLDASRIGEAGYTVTIRCHPMAGQESILPKLGFSLPRNFVFDIARSIPESLSSCQTVVYTWTTVAAEALALGIPAIYLDILYPLYVDPLFECNGLHGAVSRPEELLPEITRFTSMQENTFAAQQLQARAYIKDYFYPATQSNLKPFFPTQD